jgi:hexulose-6-phosphate isomerase
VELPSLATGLYWSYSLTSNDSAVRQKARDIALRQLETAAVLGADTILVVPGAVGVDFIPNHPVVDYAAAYDRSLEALTALKGRAEALRIHIGLENVWNKFLLSPLEMRDFIDRIDSPYMGAYLDVGNVIPTGYPEHWTAILNHRIRKVHFKDFRRAVGTLPGFVDLLAGDVNYPAVMAALGKAGYDGYVIAEMIPAYGHYPDQILYNTSASMDRILGRGGVSL